MENRTISNRQQDRPKPGSRIWWFAVFVLAIGIGLGAWYWRTARTAGAQAEKETPETYQTTEVRRGDLARTINGSGTLAAGATVDLGFSVEGTLGELSVQPGDVVTQGQELARLVDVEALEQAVRVQELSVRTAEQTLSELQSSAGMGLAQAQANLAAAQQALADARANLHEKGDPRCAKSKTETFYYEWLYAQHRVDEWEGYLNDPNTGYGHDYILQKLAPMRKERDAAYNNWKYCEGYSDQEIETSQANLQTAEANLAQAQAAYQALQSSGGIDQLALAIAEAALKNARLQLTQAQNNLAGTVITAPMDGTVIAVNGSLGERVGTGTLISLADMEQPQITVHVDEVDLADFSTGCDALVTFTALPGQTYQGVISDTSPKLVTVQSVGMVEGTVVLDQTRQLNGKPFSPGMSASVEVTCQRVEDALIISNLGLHEDEDGATYVYMLDAQGQPEKRAVEVGIETVATVEILGGLALGERVIISEVE